MTSPRLVLASASPRRVELLNSAGFDPFVWPADIDESVLDAEAADQYVLRLARSKAAAVGEPSDVILAADTCVVDGSRILGKPTDRADASDMLRSLSGRSHTVMTGVAVRNGDRVEVCLATTTVNFADLGEDDIDWYVDTGEPSDKAGAYAIQGRAASFVESVEGSVSNVIGLPLTETLELLSRFGIGRSSVRSHR